MMIMGMVMEVVVAVLEMGVARGVAGAVQRRTSKRRRHDGSDTDSESDAEWRYAEDGDEGDDRGGVGVYMREFLEKAYSRQQDLLPQAAVGARTFSPEGWSNGRLPVPLLT